MADATTTVAQLRQAWRQFVADRSWERFHSPKNLVMGLAVEVAELMEHFLWMPEEASREVVKDPTRLMAIAEEMADVAGYLIALANMLDVDLSQAIQAKLLKNADKYPVDQYHGRYRLDE